MDLRLLLVYSYGRRKEYGQMGPRLVRRQEFRNCCAPICLRHNISDQAVSLDGWSGYRLCGYIIDAWCSHTVEVDGECFSDVELLIWRCLPYHHQHCLLPFTFTRHKFIFHYATLCTRKWLMCSTYTGVHMCNCSSVIGMYNTWAELPEDVKCISVLTNIEVVL